MALLLGLYGRKIGSYGEQLLPMFDAIIERYRLGPRATELLLEGDGDKFRYPKYDYVRRAVASGRYRHILSLGIHQKESGEGIVDAPDLVLGFGMKTIKSGLYDYDGFHVCVYVGCSSCGWPEVRSLLELLPEALDIRYGFGACVPVDLMPSITVSGDANYNLRAAAHGLKQGWHLQDRMRDVCAFNMLSADHLARSIGSVTLRQWIDQEECGSLTEFRDFWIWEPPRDRIDALRDMLEASGVLVSMTPPDGEAPDKQHIPVSEDAPPPVPAAIDAARRDALVARMRAASPRLIAVTLDEFFQGNDDPASFWCNLAEPVSLTRAHDILRKIAARSEVYDVRVVLKQFDGGESEWPFSDTILAVTSAEPKDLRRWLGRKHAPDELEVAPSQAALANLIDLGSLRVPPGMHIVMAWWD